MRVLRFLWQRALAFDRLGSRIPQLIQIWLKEFFVVMPLMFRLRSFMSTMRDEPVG